MRSSRLTPYAVPAAFTAILITTTLVTAADATTVPGTPGRDITIGRDNDNAANRFVQPAGVATKQHMENTDVLFGRANDDLLVGRAGSDTLLAGSGDDILVGGPENFTAPNSDVLVGDLGDDVNIWAPGDGSDAFIGNEGSDTMIFAPLRKNPNGSLRLVRYGARMVPKVATGSAPQFSCTIIKVPAAQQLGFEHLVRFNVNKVPAVTVRLKNVERVLCPSPSAGRVRVASLTAPYPKFADVRTSSISGVTGAIIR